MNMASLSSNPAENSINVEVKISEITENPANTELETSLEPKPSTIKGSLVLQETAFFGTGESCQITKNDNVVMIHPFNGTINL